jgi:hypothetical protein
MGSKVVNEDKITQVNIFMYEYCEHTSYLSNGNTGNIFMKFQNTTRKRGLNNKNYTDTKMNTEYYKRLAVQVRCKDHNCRP